MFNEVKNKVTEMPWYHCFSDSSRKEANLFASSFKTSEKHVILLSLVFFCISFSNFGKNMLFCFHSCFLFHKYPSCFNLIFHSLSLFISLYSFCSMYCRWGGQRPYKLELFDAGGCHLAATLWRTRECLTSRLAQ